MTYGTRTGGYPASSKWLHWAVAACVLTIIPVAITMKNVSEGPLQDTLYNLHKSLGALIDRDVRLERPALVHAGRCGLRRNRRLRAARRFRRGRGRSRV